MQRKSIFFGAVISAAMFVGIFINPSLVSITKNKTSNLTLERICSYTGEGEGESGGFDCMMRKDPCIFEPSLSAHLAVLRKLGYFEAKIGGKIDITNSTQIYYKKAFYWPLDEKVRCGKDVTCYDLIAKICGW
jgi:hypothetical protein